MDEFRNWKPQLQIKEEELMGYNCFLNLSHFIPLLRKFHRLPFPSFVQYASLIDRQASTLAKIWCLYFLFCYHWIAFLTIMSTKRYSNRRILRFLIKLLRCRPRRHRIPLAKVAYYVPNLLISFKMVSSLYRSNLSPTNNRLFCFRFGNLSNI